MTGKVVFTMAHLIVEKMDKLQVINLKFIDTFFETKYNTLALWEDLPQLYTLISGVKK